MAKTTTKRRTPAKAPAARQRAPARRPAAAVDRTATELSDEVLESIEASQRAAIEAVRKFVDTVDQKLPGSGVEPSWRQDIVDSAMEMADRLVHTQYDFIRKVIGSAGRTLTRPEAKKSDGS